ncbi:hypothetical protein BT69DRAFT_109908 [Atractiella rhizophila]|nr:hypothetical protein BT69DRAFT_109908 [Atractiella rhizophila]
MSSLDRAAIRGIRSFDTTTLSIIQFYTPLTVIVGHNGSGKTTIIECLKYATTGDLPPNTKGGAFVHDPQMAGSKEIKAEVKLRFKNTNGERMIVDRRLQVTKKATTYSMKTLEGTLSYADGGEDASRRRTVSTKCSELDEEIPIQLGVSKSILENVIFCHQEDSNWPLSEPATLKKKFDEIFEATKYTKALDNIKSLRKDMTNEIKVDRERLISLRTDRERAQKLEKAISVLESEIRAKREEYDDLARGVKEQQATNQEFYQATTQYTETLQKHKMLLAEQKRTESNAEVIRENMTELPDSTEELKEKVRNYDAHLESHKKSIAQKQELVSEEKKKAAQLVRKQNAKLAEEGKLKAELQRYHEQRAELRKMVTTKSVKHSILGYGRDGLEDDEIKEFIRILDNVCQTLEAELAELKGESRRKEGEKARELETFRNKESLHNQSCRQIKEQIDTTKRNHSN